jgi:adenine phosphoribosyltransferase
MRDLAAFIRQIPDYPKPGIRFYDLSTLIQSPAGFRLALDRMQEHAASLDISKVVGIEARGFVFGGALADRMNLGLVIARKPGKLPGKTISQEYALEYGTDRIEMHSDSILAGDRILVVDDLIATGGTLAATCQLVEKLGGEVAAVSAVVGLDYLPYQEKLQKYDINCLITYHSE